MLYLLWWDNDLEYADAETTLLGFYQSLEAREAAKQRYEMLRGKQWPFSGGRFVLSEERIGVDLISAR